MTPVAEVAPYTYPSKPFAVDPRLPHRKGYEGVLLDMMDEFVLIPSSLNPPLPRMIFTNISTEFGSEESFCLEQLHRLRL